MEKCAPWDFRIYPLIERTYDHLPPSCAFPAPCKVEAFLITVGIKMWS
jgi:hypothetical protein